VHGLFCCMLKKNIMYRFVFVFLLLVGRTAAAQPARYTVENLHSHNDYEKLFPFHGAFNRGFGSIEADIFLYRGRLIVAHDTAQRARGRTLDSMYLKPLDSSMLVNHGYPYPDSARSLQLLIDLKTDSTATLAQLLKELKKYPRLTAGGKLQVVITGNRPNLADFARYPAFISFDGELHVVYPDKACSRISMLSDNFKNFSKWDGQSPLPEADSIVLAHIVTGGHALHKKVRFWNAPDNPAAWKVFMKLGVDYLNTDHINAAADFMAAHP
jgi:alkaline phosphatase